MHFLFDEHPAGIFREKSGVGGFQLIVFGVQFGERSAERFPQRMKQKRLSQKEPGGEFQDVAQQTRGTVSGKISGEGDFDQQGQSISCQQVSEYRSRKKMTLPEEE